MEIIFYYQSIFQIFNLKNLFKKNRHESYEISYAILGSTNAEYEYVFIHFFCGQSKLCTVRTIIVISETKSSPHTNIVVAFCSAV